MLLVALSNRAMLHDMKCLLTGYSRHQFEGSEYPNSSESTEVHVHIFIIREECNEPVEAITSYHYHKLLLTLRANT